MATLFTHHNRGLAHQPQQFPALQHSQFRNEGENFRLTVPCRFQYSLAKISAIYGQ
jgi:hypothetical protein